VIITIIYIQYYINIIVVNNFHIKTLNDTKHQIINNQYDILKNDILNKINK